MPEVMSGLSGHRKSISGSNILVLGIAYKINVDDMRELPSVEIMKLLEEKGTIIEYCDPYVPGFPTMRKYKFNLSSIALRVK